MASYLLKSKNSLVPAGSANLAHKRVQWREKFDGRNSWRLIFTAGACSKATVQIEDIDVTLV